MENIRRRTRMLALLGLLLGMILVLSAVEHALPPLPFLPPNVRLGLSNVITMYTLFFLGRRPALLLVLLKSLFVMMMRGPTAGALSFCGGALSILVIMLLAAVFRERISYLILSVAGAISHNIGQIAMASVLLGTNLVLPFLPVLLVSGVVLGSVTGTLLRVVLPLLGGLERRGGKG